MFYMTEQFSQSMERTTAVLSKLREDLKILKTKKSTMKKDDYDRTLEILVNNANKEYRRVRLKIPCKKSHRRRINQMVSFWYKH